MAEIEENMKNLVGIAILEKDIYQDVLPVWEYPSISEDLESTILNRSQLSEENNEDEEAELEDYYFSKFRNNWIYTHLFPVNDSQILSRVVVFEINVISNDFNPEKYNALCKVFGSIYSEHGSGPKILEAYLSIFVKGTLSKPSFNVSNYPARAALLQSPLKDLIKLFSGTLTPLWTGILTKKKIAVLANSRTNLCKVIRSFPLLTFHRSDWSILRPFTKFSEIEQKDWEDTRVVVYGTLDDSVRDREKDWDILVDVNNREVIVSSFAAKTGFNNVCKIQQDFIEFLLEQAEIEQPDSTLIKNLTLKTQELLKKLNSLKVGDEDNTYLDFPTLQNMNLPPYTDQFLFSVGSAEGMVKI